MWTPAVALLWECWRLSRRRMASMIACATFTGAALLASSLSRDYSMKYTVILAGLSAWIGQWWAVARPNRGRKGFTLTLGFTRPVATWQLVAIPLSYVAVAGGVTYLVPVVVLSSAFGVALPLLPMATLCALLSLMWVAAIWWTDDPVLRLLTIVSLYLVGVPASGILPARWWQSLSLSDETYGWKAFASAVVFAATIAGVARQRRGDRLSLSSWLASVRTRARADRGWPAWLGELTGLRCPVSSPTLAQLWFEVHTLGGRTVSWGLLVALGVLVFLTLAQPVGAAAAVVSLTMIGMLLPVFVAIPSLLGLTRKEGHTYLSAFAGTRPLGTVALLRLKVLVGTLALLAAWGAIAASRWIFVHLIAKGDPGLQAILSEFALPIPEGGAGVLVRAALLIQVTAAVAWAAALHALLVLHGKRLLLGALGVAVYITVLVVLVVQGWGDGEVIFEIHLVAVAGGLTLGIAFVLWRALVQGIYSARNLALVVVAGLAFAIATLGSNREFVNPGGKELADSLIGLIIGLLPLAAAAFAPLAFSRLRHR